MAIRSEPFGGIRLTGEDAKAFNQQIINGLTNPLAKENIDRGVALAREYRKNNNYLRLNSPKDVRAPRVRDDR